MEEKEVADQIIIQNLAHEAKKFLRFHESIATRPDKEFFIAFAAIKTLEDILATKEPSKPAQDYLNMYTLLETMIIRVLIRLYGPEQVETLLSGEDTCQMN